jgi:hypothetical protein
MTTKGKTNPVLIALTVFTIAMSSWGLFRLLVEYADAPPTLALIGVACADLVAVGFGWHALKVSEDGDSSGFWNVAMLAVTMLAAFIQFSHAQLEGWPIALGLFFGGLPIFTVLLFEGQLRRRAKIVGRETGRVAPPRATFEPIMWLLYLREVRLATRIAARDRSLGPDQALQIAEGMLAHREAKLRAEQIRPPAIRDYTAEIAWSQPVRELPPGHSVATAPDSVATAPDTAPVGAEVRGAFEELRDYAEHKPPVAPIVRAAVEKVGADLDAVLSEVRVIRPDVERETVRRTLARIPTNGASHG